MSKIKETKKEKTNIEKETKEEKKPSEIDLLKEELTKESDKYTRLQAEFINYQTRTQNEISNMFKYEGESAIMMDDNDLSDEVSNFLKGFKMVYTRLIGIMDSLEVKPIDVEGKEFDPHFAEAVLTEHNENLPENVVLEVLKKGYMYKDKLIRPAMVKVNK